MLSHQARHARFALQRSNHDRRRAGKRARQQRGAIDGVKLAPEADVLTTKHRQHNLQGFFETCYMTLEIKSVGLVL